MICILFFDTETNGLLYEVSKIHCIVTHDTRETGFKFFFNQAELPSMQCHGSVVDGIKYINNYNGTSSGHNICGYDFPVFRKLHPQVTKHWPPLLTNKSLTKGKGVPRPMDTYILSCMLYPQQQEHGLEYWGKKLGHEKPVQEDWSKLTEDVLKRCMADVTINVMLYNELRKRKQEFHERMPSQIVWLNALDLEQQVQQIHAEQEITGVRYDILKAVKLQKELDAKADYLAGKIQAVAPPTLVNTHTVEVKKPYLKTGKYSKMVLDHFGTESQADAAKIGGPFTRIRFDKINLDSDVQVKKYLLSLGWKPTEWNYSKKTKERTSPKLTEDSYRSLPPGVGQDIAEYNIVTHRRGMILNRKGDEKGGLWVCNERPDRRIPAEAYTCGTPTARYRHKRVICNIPRTSSPYGNEIRELFCVPDNWWMLGLDLKGIEIRMMVHFAYPYPGGKAFYDIVMDGDFHANNGRMWNVSRDDSKPGLYGLCYGAQAKKLANILGKPERDGQVLYNAFWNTYPALRHLVDNLERSYKRNRCLVGIDGRRIDVREKRKLLNTLIQSASAVVFKEWMRFNYQDTPDYVEQIIAYHDELQYECRTFEREHVEVVAKRFADNACDVGRKYNLYVPIEADYKIGKNWRDTH